MSNQTTRVVHVNDRAPGAVYIGRASNRHGLKASPFANPFRVEDHGRWLAIMLYRDYLLSSKQGRATLARLPGLRGKPLACWCRRSGQASPPCHGDVLVELLDRYTDAELLAISAGERAFADEGLVSPERQMSEQPNAIAAIRRRAAAAAPGPWMWSGNVDVHQFRLCTRDHGRRVVMGFRRLGLHDAQPEFRNSDGGLIAASRLAIYEACAEATSRDDPRVHRGNIVGFRHPDAEFVAHARQDVETLLAEIDRLRAIGGETGLAAAGLIVAPESVVRDAATLLRLGSVGNPRAMQETADALDAALGDSDEAPDSRFGDWMIDIYPASLIKQWIESVAINSDMATRARGRSHETDDDADRAATVSFDRRDEAMRAIYQLADQLMVQRDAALARARRLEALCRRTEAAIMDWHETDGKPADLMTDEERALAEAHQDLRAAMDRSDDDPTMDVSGDE